jgi:hypothetical protein
LFLVILIDKRYPIKHDSEDRIEAGDAYENMYRKHPKPKFQFQKKFYVKNHNSVVPPAMFDGISFIYKDYKKQDKYTTFYDLRDNYAEDMKKLYGLEINFSMSDMETVLTQLFESKDVEQLDAYHAFVKEHKLWQNAVMKEPGGMDAMNQGNFYYHIGAFETSAQQYEEALAQLNVTVEPMVYFGNFDFLVDSFKQVGDYNKLMDILIQSRDFAANNRIYDGGNKGTLLKLNYLIAKVSAEHNIAKKEGKQARQYCIENYYENTLFDLEEMKQLSI